MQNEKGRETHPLFHFVARKHAQQSWMNSSSSSLFIFFIGLQNRNAWKKNNFVRDTAGKFWRSTRTAPPLWPFLCSSESSRATSGRWPRKIHTREEEEAMWRVPHTASVLSRELIRESIWSQQASVMSVSAFDLVGAQYQLGVASWTCSLLSEVSLQWLNKSQI